VCGGDAHLGGGRKLLFVCLFNIGSPQERWSVIGEDQQCVLVDRPDICVNDQGPGVKSGLRECLCALKGLCLASAVFCIV
jgi:hypothetical protein